MAAPSPNVISAHRDSAYSEDEDKVLFRSPSEKPPSGPNSAITPIGAKRTSLGVSPHQSAFTNGKDHSPDTATQWSFPQQNDQTWGMDNLKISDGVENGVLAPAAEINELGAGPHSRQSSAGGSSNFDSPALPTPGQGKVDSPDVDKTFKGQPFSPAPLNPNGYYGYDNGMGFMADHFSAAAGLMNGHIASPTQLGALGAMSPLGGALPRGMPFSPHLAGHIPPLNLQAESQQGFPTQEDFASYAAANGRMNGRGAAPPPAGRGQPNGAAASPTAYPTLNGQPAPTANGLPAGYPYNSPPSQPTNPYAAGMMSPTITSPTFLPSAVYGSPMAAANPYGVYGATQASSALYDMMSPQGQLNGPMSPQAIASALPGRTQASIRGHGYSASNPATLRDAVGLGQRQQGAPVRAQGPTSPTGRLGGQQRQQPPRATQVNIMNHAHSLSLPHATPYSPQLAAQAYGPMSPPPYPPYFPAFSTPGLNQQQADLLQAAAMVGMAAMAQQQGRPAGYNPSVQTALTGLQKDPAVMALIQAGGGPSANNRKLGLYKTELCRSWEEKGSCKYGEKCQFAHGDAEQRKVERHPKYKTEICRTFWVSGSCPYGKRCCFIHTELPASSGAVPGQGDGQRGGTTPTQVGNPNERQQPDGRARSMSTNSDPNDPPSSLLARISARAQANQGGTPTGVNAGGLPPRSTDASPSQLAEAIARAYNAYGMPGGQSQMHTPPAPPEPTPPPQPQTASNGVFSGFSSRGAGTPNSAFGTAGTSGGHHRVSASVDFGRSGRGLGSDLTLGLGHGLGHQRNPSASSIVPPSSAFPLSKTPLSGQSTPFGDGVRGVAVGSSLLEHW